MDDPVIIFYQYDVYRGPHMMGTFPNTRLELLGTMSFIEPQGEIKSVVEYLQSRSLTRTCTLFDLTRSWVSVLSRNARCSRRSYDK